MLSKPAADFEALLDQIEQFLVERDHYSDELDSICGRLAKALAEQRAQRVVYVVEYRSYLGGNPDFMDCTVHYVASSLANAVAWIRSTKDEFDKPGAEDYWWWIDAEPVDTESYALLTDRTYAGWYERHLIDGHSGHPYDKDGYRCSDQPARTRV